MVELGAHGQAEFATYFVADIDQQGGEAALAEANRLVSLYTAAGWHVESMLPLGGSRLTVSGGELSGLKVVILWRKD